MPHCFAKSSRFVILPFRKMFFRFACFSKNRDAKQLTHFAKRPSVSLVSLLRETEVNRFVKNPCLEA
jgi:hypothetical protein